MELNGNAQSLIMRSMKLLRDQLESEKRDDDRPILTDILNDSISTLNDLINRVELSSVRSPRRLTVFRSVPLSRTSTASGT